MIIKRIGIVTPGGDAPGMNAAIRAVVRTGIGYGYEMFGIYRGYAGLIDGEIEELTSRSVGGIIEQGGTIFKSSRCKEIKTVDGQKKAVFNLAKLGISTLVVIGGDGSITAAGHLSKHGINSICIPASIDNDVYGTDETIGFDTAIDTAISAVDKIRDTAKSFQRIFIVEVMGREHGFLALSIAIASGAEFVVIPEIKTDYTKLCADLQNKINCGKMSMIIIFAEGAGNVQEAAKLISKKLKFDVRVSSLGYIQRGGSPSARSRILATEFGWYAIELIKKGIRNSVVVTRECKLTHVPIMEVVRNCKKIDPRFINNLIQKVAI